MFEEVVGKRLNLFKIEDIVADKAYSSRKVIGFIDSLGLNPYIPFKSNARGTAKGYRSWRTIFEKFTNKREEFMKIYHQRSNVETSFHMVKQPFGYNLMTKTKTANINEIKAKFLCHNICVLIQEVFERGIEIDFQSCVKTSKLCN